MWGLLFTSKGTSSFLFKSKRKYIIEALKTKINCVTYGQWTRRVAYHTHRGTHSKHETLSYLARTRIKVCFSTLPSFGGRGPTGSSSLQTALFTPWCSLLHLVTCFWWEIVSFSIATRTSGSWWSCSGCETDQFYPWDKARKQARQDLEPPPCNTICPDFYAAISPAYICDQRDVQRCHTTTTSVTGLGNLIYWHLFALNLTCW